MTLLEWTASIISSLAWPATVLITTLLLRKPLSQVILTISKIKYGKLEGESPRVYRRVFYLSHAALADSPVDA